MALGDKSMRAPICTSLDVWVHPLTGEQVFTATVLNVITQHLQAVPVPPSERTELPIPATLEHLVLACLAKKPEDRPQNARQLAQSLDAIEGLSWGEEEALDGGASITRHQRRYPTRLRSEPGTQGPAARSALRKRHRAMTGRR